MKKSAELVKAIILLPGSMLILIPSLILYSTRSFHFLCGVEFPQAWIIFGAAFFFSFVGISLAIKTVSLFATVGDGTPAPWAPPKHFVVRGPYCYVRNPMLFSAILILLGEAIFFGSLPVLFWCVIFWGMSTIYFILFEEHGLAKRFGNDYLEYKKNVRRWIPRLSPWKQNKN